MLVTRDGWNVSFETITFGEGKLQGSTLRVFRMVNGKPDRCSHCDKKLFDTQEEAEEHAFQHGHLKQFSWLKLDTKEVEDEVASEASIHAH